MNASATSINLYTAHGGEEVLTAENTVISTRKVFLYFFKPLAVVLFNWHCLMRAATAAWITQFPHFHATQRRVRCQ